MQNSRDDEVPSGILKEQQNKKENWVNVELFLMWYVVFYNTKPGWVNIYENDPVYIHRMHNNNSKQGGNNIRIYEKYPDFMKRCVCVCLPDNTSFTVSLSVSVVPQADGFTVQEGLPHAASERCCSYCICFLKRQKETNQVRKDKTCCSTQTDRERETGSRYLDRAEYSSYKQVGVLVDVQDGVGRGRVGTGRCRHHTSHGAFQRIYWYGAVQAITADREGLMLFCLPFSISVKTDHLTQDSFTPSRLPTCAVHFHPGDFPKVFSTGIAQTISLKNVPLHNTETLLLPRKKKKKQTPRWEIYLIVQPRGSTATNWFLPVFLSFIFSAASS